MTMFSYTDNLKKCAFDAVQKPEDFGYWGNKDMFDTWGFCGIDMNSSSSVLEVSNFKTITDKFINLYPNDFRIEGFKHWAVGHVDRLTCRVYEVVNGKKIITETFSKIMEVLDELNDYPIYDEDNYSDLLYEEALEYLRDLPNYLAKMIDLKIEGYEDMIYSEIVNMDIMFDVDAQEYPSDDDILEAVYIRGIWNEDEIEEWDSWTKSKGYPVISTSKVIDDQPKLFEGF